MELVERILGNVSEGAWRERLKGARLDPLDLHQWDAQKNRLRRRTASGREVAVSLDRDCFLRDGDVLLWDEAEGTAVVARIRLCEVMAVSLRELLHRSPDEIIETCVRLGHALGNQHWPAVVRGDTVYVPLTVDRKVMESVMESHRLKDISYLFLEGDSVSGLLEPHEARRLFGGSEMGAGEESAGVHGGHGHGGMGHRHGGDRHAGNRGEVPL